MRFPSQPEFDADAYRGVRALVIGATGFIGASVARNLSATGADLHLLVRDATAASRAFPRFRRNRIHVLDLVSSGRLAALFREVQPAVVFNLAAYGVDRAERDPALAARINFELVEEIVLALASTAGPRQTGQAVVHVGSALEYGRAGGDLAEDTEPSPDTLYGLTKLAGTRALRGACTRTGIRGLTVRLFTVYGPGEQANRLFPALAATAMSSGALALTSGNQRRDFTYVEDVAEGLLRLGLTDSDPGEVVNLATGRLWTVREFALAAAQELKLPVGRLGFGELPDRPDEMDHAPVNVERLRARTRGWLPPTDVQTGIRLTAAQLRTLRSAAAAPRYSRAISARAPLLPG